MKWQPSFFLPLFLMSVRDVPYNRMARILGVVPSTITQWMKKYLPDEFARRQEERGMWRPVFLSDLRALCNGEYTFEDIGRFFGVGASAARDWVEKYLGADAYHTVARKHRWYAIDADTARAMTQMRTGDGATLKAIADFFGFSIGTVSELLRGTPRGVPDGANDTTSSDEEPSLADLKELQRQIDSGEFVL